MSLRTVPIWLSANGKKIKVNALLDDASSVSYVNEELAGALGLSATYDQVTVSMTLESCDGNVRLPFKALTCPRRVTGNYNAVVWSKFQDRWPHLRVCKFPEPPAEPIVDVLIGQDQIDLHYSKCDVRGNLGEPIARLGHLGWSCVALTLSLVESNESSMYVDLITASAARGNFSSWILAFSWDFKGELLSGRIWPVRFSPDLIY